MACTTSTSLSYGAEVANAPGSDSSLLIANTSWVQGEISGLGTVTSVGTGTGLTGGPITGSGTVSLANTAVSPATYDFATITVDAQGRLTSASGGTPVLGTTATAPVASTGGQNPIISMVPATASVPGHMTTAFATKLNGIEALAEVNAVDTVFGRSGVVVAVTNDYTIQQIDNVTISDSAPSGGGNGDIWLEY